MLMSMAAEMISRLEKEFQKACPEEKEQFIKSSLSLMQAIISEAKK